MFIFAAIFMSKSSGIIEATVNLINGDIIEQYKHTII